MAKIKEFPKVVVTKACNASHKMEHPVHLVYFLMIASHGAYHYAAMVCLVVGLLCMVPTKTGNHGGDEE